MNGEEIPDDTGINNSEIESGGLLKSKYVINMKCETEIVHSTVVNMKCETEIVLGAILGLKLGSILGKESTAKNIVWKWKGAGKVNIFGTGLGHRLEIEL